MALVANPETVEEARSLKSRLVRRMYGEAIGGRIATGATQRSYLKDIPGESNIVGFGYGTKWTSGSVSSERAIRVYVTSKRPRRRLSERHIIPDEIDGVPTDVVQVGHVVAAFPRPIGGGVSGGHPLVPFGTLGCLVQRNEGGRFVLSNNHVLANVNDSSSPAPEILEPGLRDGGLANPPIARLAAFHPLSMEDGINEIDAAVAELVNQADMTNEIVDVGRISPDPLLPTAQMSVTKHGATTRRRTGIVDDIDTDVIVGFAPHGVAHFHHQIAIRDGDEVFADNGDSGSIVVDPVTLRPVGLLFAIGDGMTYCNYIGRVLDELGLRIL
jgi:hypothetical protein